MASNGTSLPLRPAPTAQTVPTQADELDDLLTSVRSFLHPYMTAATTDATALSSGHGLAHPGSGPRTVLAEYHPPKKLSSLFPFTLPSSPGGKSALLPLIESLLQYSVNTWSQGFLDKLYASTTPVGVISELVLAVLNTNLHVYNVSPALTLIERDTARALAGLYGLKGGNAGGVTQPGGSAANATALVVARNTLFPETKTEGLGGRKWVLFTSAHGHYSLEKAAQIQGFGSNAVRSVPVDAAGRMRVEELERMVQEAKGKGETPFFVNTTAGTTVLGSWDPIAEISEVCKREGLWLHVDGSWGGPVVYSRKHRGKLAGSEKADSIAVCPHKMMGVPLTCSFLLGRDLRTFHKAMTLPAGYLFHQPEEDKTPVQSTNGVNGDEKVAKEDEKTEDFWDLADLTPQCGRKGDALKLALSWVYYGTEGYEQRIDAAFDIATYLATLVSDHPDFELVSETPPPCLQVCFYYKKQSGSDAKDTNSKTTETIARRLIPRGFMIDYAPGEDGKFFRVVVNGQTMRGTVEGLVKAISAIGDDIKV